MDEFGQHAAQPDAHDERAFPRFDVDIARAGVDGVEEQAIDEYPDFNGVFGGFRLEVLNGMIHAVVFLDCCLLVFQGLDQKEVA